MQKYPPSGALFINDRKVKDTHPDYNGNLSLSEEVVSDLVSQMSEGAEEMTLDLSGFKKVSRGGKRYLSLRGSISWKRNNAQSRKNTSRLKESGDYDSSSDSEMDDEIPF